MSTDIATYEASSDEKTMAIVAHLSPLMLGIFGPLLVYILKKDESPFIAYHAMQAIIYQAINLVFIFVILLPIVFCTFGLGGFLGFLPMLGSIYGVMKANEGVFQGYPGWGHVGLPKD